MSQNCRTHFKNLAAFVSIKKLNYFSNPLSSTAADTKEYWTTEMKNIGKGMESPQLIKEFFKYRIKAKKRRESPQLVKSEGKGIPTTRESPQQGNPHNKGIPVKSEGNPHKGIPPILVKSEGNPHNLSKNSSNIV